MNRQRGLVLAGAGATMTATAALVLGLRRPRAAEMGVLRTVDFVDLERYAGRWFEVASYPSRFERHCLKNMTVDYAVRPDGRLHVEARCTVQDGTVDTSRGVAKVADRATNAKLRIKYGRRAPWMDYWVIDLEENYRWAVVGEPKRQFVWVLSRTPGLDDDTYSRIAANVVTQGYDPERLVRTQQDGA